MLICTIRVKLFQKSLAYKIICKRNDKEHRLYRKTIISCTYYYTNYRYVNPFFFFFNDNIKLNIVTFYTRLFELLFG